MKKILFLIFCILILSEINFAQKHNNNNSLDEQDSILIKKLAKKHQSGFFGFSYTNAIAQKELQTNFNKSDVGAGQGFSVYGGYSPEFLPINFGMDINFIFWSSDTKTTKYGGFPYYYDTLTASNNGIPINLYFQFKPDLISYIKPYIEGFAGITVYSGSLDYKSNYVSMNQTETNTSASYNYGIGAGALINLGETVKLPDTRTTYNLDIKFRYSLGDKTPFKMKFLDNTGAIYSNNFESKTDVIYFYLGFLVEF